MKYDELVKSLHHLIFVIPAKLVLDLIGERESSIQHSRQIGISALLQPAPSFQHQVSSFQFQIIPDKRDLRFATSIINHQSYDPKLPLPYGAALPAYRAFADTDLALIWNAFKS